MIISPNWQSPNQVKAFTSTRLSEHGFYSFQYFNLALSGAGHDQQDRQVIDKRDEFSKAQSLPSSPVWLDQTHSNEAVDITSLNLKNADEFTVGGYNPTAFFRLNSKNADASITRNAGQVLAIQTADCLPILMTNKEGSEVAAIHAGWRGLCNGIIENTLKKMRSNPNECMAWIGPSICGHCFEVGEEVCDQFIENYAFSPRYCFLQHKWHIHLDRIAAHILLLNCVLSVQKSNLCTFEQKNLFYSYRRSGQTGRIGTFIWFN